MPPNTGRKYIGLNINMDTLSECAELVGADPRKIHRIMDPCYTTIIERFEALFAKYKAEGFSLFVIGQDVRHPYVKDALRHWSARGVEIGNHTWSHHSNFGWRKESAIEDEVKRCHDMVAETINIAPVGFISPVWSFSLRLHAVLSRLGYCYDTSPAPTILLDLAQVLLWMRSPGRRESIPLMRPDLIQRWAGRTQPYYYDSRLMVGVARAE
jgi:peptidoglycan/xylan/chitin deacetylase (PgdA/CDA1 family)